MSSGSEKSIRPFIFEQSFDILVSQEELETIEQKEEEEAAPTFSEEELRAAREDSYKQGLQVGLQEATTGIEQQVATTLEVLGATLDQLSEQQQIANELIARETIDLAIAAVAKLLPEYVQSHGTAEVEKFVSDITSRILEEPHITIRVADEIVPAIKSNLIDLAERTGFSGTLAVTGDGELGLADCRIRWSEGEAERIIDATLREIEALSQSVPRHMPSSELEIAADPPGTLPADGMETTMTAEAETAQELAELQTTEAAVAVPEILKLTNETSGAVPSHAKTLAADQGMSMRQISPAEPAGDSSGEFIDVPRSNVDQEEKTDDVPEMPVKTIPV
jgi:flagellar biosynthesis/type III secretory pathway protein FliH